MTTGLCRSNCGISRADHGLTHRRHRERATSRRTKEVVFVIDQRVHHAGRRESGVPRNGVPTTHHDLSIRLVTGQTVDEIAAEAISAGVTDYIQKEPGTSQYTVLANRVQNAVEARRDELQVTRGHRAMNAAWDGISTLDHEGRFTYLNDAYAATFGYEREELLGDHWQKIHSAEGLETVNGEILPAVDERDVDERAVERAGLERVGELDRREHREDGADCVVRDRTDREVLTNVCDTARTVRLLVDAVENYAIFLLDPDGLILVERGCKRHPAAG